MRLHPRSRIVEAAKVDMARATTEVIGRHELTHAELSHILIGIMAQWNKYAIRDERDEPGTTKEEWDTFRKTANETGKAEPNTPEGQSALRAEVEEWKDRAIKAENANLDQLFVRMGISTKRPSPE